MNQDKARLRSELLQQRGSFNLPPESWNLLLQLNEIKKANKIGSYLAFGQEPQTDFLNHELLTAGKELFLPRTIKDQPLEWVKWSGKVAELTPSPLFNGKVLEPIGSATGIEQIEVLILPALAVDKDGVRLGRGGGYYDRSLFGYPGVKVALIYEGEYLTKLPTEDFDQSVNYAITPTQIIAFN